MTITQKLSSPADALTGLRYQPEFLPLDEETALIQELSRLDRHPYGFFARHGRVFKRREFYFTYDWGRGRRALDKDKQLPGPIKLVWHRCASAVGLRADAIQDVMESIHRPGAWIDWNVKSISASDNIIFSISLQSACTIRFRRLDDPRVTWQFQLEPRSLIVMSGPSRFEWLHQLKPVKNARYCITMRAMLES